MAALFGLAADLLPAALVIIALVAVLRRQR